MIPTLIFIHNEGFILKISVREAVASDISIIHDFIIGLADSLQMRDRVEVQPENLKTSLFPYSGNPDAFVLIAEINNDPTGMAIYFKNFSTFKGQAGIHLEDLYVLPKYRKKGIGKALLSVLSRIAIACDFHHVDWSVPNNNTDAQGFYRYMNATPDSDWMNWQLSKENLLLLAKDNSWE